MKYLSTYITKILYIKTDSLIIYFNTNFIHINVDTFTKFTLPLHNLTRPVKSHSNRFKPKTPGREFDSYIPRSSVNTLL